MSEPLTKLVSHHDPCAYRLESALGTIATRRSSSGSSQTLDLSGTIHHTRSNILSNQIVYDKLKLYTSM